MFPSLPCLLLNNLNLAELLKVVASLATLLLAIVNLGFVIYFFWYKDRKENLEKSSDRRIEWFRSLILDFTLKDFYAFFSNVEDHCKVLAAGQSSDETKRDVEQSVRTEAQTLRQKFLDPLLAVDEGLY